MIGVFSRAVKINALTQFIYLVNDYERLNVCPNIVSITWVQIGSWSGSDRQQKQPIKMENANM